MQFFSLSPAIVYLFIRGFWVVLIRAVTILLCGLLVIYRYAISPVLFCLFGASCRFAPNCSCYAQQCLKQYPLSKALPKIAMRLLRCHPYSRGGVDLP